MSASLKSTNGRMNRANIVVNPGKKAEKLQRLEHVQQTPIPPVADPHLKIVSIEQALVRYVCVFSLFVCVYAHIIENRIHTNRNQPFNSLCDISDRMSCSRVLSSEYGRLLRLFGIVKQDSLFDLTNVDFGFCYYAIVLLVWKPSSTQDSISTDLLFAAATGSMIASAYLSYVLWKILADVCLICLSSYLCNFIIFASMGCCIVKRMIASSYE